MKIIFTVIILSLLLIFVGCSAKLSFYNSKADISQLSSSILTEAKLINWPEDQRYSFGVVVATDKKTFDSSLIHYALFVPGRSGSGAKDIFDLRIEYASPVMEKDLEYFAYELDKILRNWSNKTSTSEGTYYNYYSEPVETQMSEGLNESDWNPSVKFEFQNTGKKLIGLLTIGPDSYKYKYTFDDMKEMAALQMVITKALSEIRDREKNEYEYLK